MTESSHVTPSQIISVFLTQDRLSVRQCEALLHPETLLRLSWHSHYIQLAHLLTTPSRHCLVVGEKHAAEQTLAFERPQDACMGIDDLQTSYVCTQFAEVVHILPRMHNTLLWHKHIIHNDGGVLFPCLLICIVIAKST